jgi:hypothetical protein
MNENDQIRTLLADLADDAPPMDIDVDRQMQRGRRRHRRRIVTSAVTVVAASAALLGGLSALRPDGTPAEVPVAGTTTDHLLPSNVRSTEKSRALLAEFERLTPELAPLGKHAFDFQTGQRSLVAGGDWSYTVKDRSTRVTVSVQVGVHKGDGGTSVPPSCQGSNRTPTCVTDNGAHVPKVCETKTGPNACTDIRKLPDGSTAYLHEYDVAGGGHSYDVRLVRTDKVEVYVGSGAATVPGDTHTAPLSLTRVLEIARGITVTP